MAQVSWTPQAADDLDALADFIARDSLHYARLLVSDILAAIEPLQDFPQAGRAVPEARDPAIREIILGNYRIIYRLKADLVQILTIHHGSRLLDPSRLT